MQQPTQQPPPTHPQTQPHIHHHPHIHPAPTASPYIHTHPHAHIRYHDPNLPEKNLHATPQQPHYTQLSHQQLHQHQVLHQKLKHASPEDVAAFEKAHVEKLREKLEESGSSLVKSSPHTTHDDLLRFLRAYHYNIDLTKNEFLGCLKFRAEHGIDQLLNDPNIINFDGLLGFFHGKDKAGDPIYIQYAGRIDIPTFLRSYDMNHIIRYLLKQLEIGIRMCPNPALGKLLFIMDWKGVHYKDMWSARKDLDGLKKMAFILQHYYPNRLEKLLVVNAPSVFSVVWKAVSPFLDPETQSKIHILGEPFIPYLLHHADANQIPVALGGSCPGACCLRQ